ncbi:MAG: carbohydrate ABC transporter substrate-binding protein [Hyphomicrobiaceae bacterium]|nr:carbohydrate ABC transporter substrate-binding protein [Hyphomicrobiaceae bacterium]
MKKFAFAALAAGLLSATAASATDLEVTHWWTSGGEAAAVAEFAKAFDNDGYGDHWVDGAIAGSGGVARPIMISRITGGDPMGATQFNHGRQAEELVQAGLMRDLTDLANSEHWADVIADKKLLDACTLDGKIYCVPVNIHSWQWIWINRHVYEDNGLAVPTDWNEFVASAPALREKGIIPLAMGNQPWQSSGAFGVMAVGIAGVDAWLKVNQDKDATVAAGPEYAKVFEAAANARLLSEGSNVQDWNQATNLVITGKAAAQIMGDWAQGEFQVAGQVAGVDYDCLPGLGINPIVSTDGDAFYFPKLSDPDQSEAQLRLAHVLFAPDTQVAFNLKKGSMPIRLDVDLNAANACMKKGIELLQAGKILPSGNQLLSPDTQGQIEDLMTQFWSSTDLSAADAQARYAEIIASAD